MSIIERILELLDSCWKKIGLSEDQKGNVLILIVIFSLLITLIRYAIKLIKWLNLRKRRRILNSNLTPFYSTSDINKATKNYIPTKYQNVSPSEDEEPGRKYIAAAKEKLIPLFIRRVFCNKSEDNRFYLLLADSGMGKTTFMLNLFLHYKNKKYFGKPKYKIKLFPLGFPNVLQELDKIGDKEKSKTILLLDAFDEDNEAIIDYEKRLGEILLIAHKYKTIVITCRTQFFPTQKEEPHETGHYKFGGDPGEYYFQKLYVSAFDNADIVKYLLRRYNILNPFKWSSFYKAYKITKKSPNLMVRPMLLSYINDLITSDKEFNYSYEIYDVLIAKWIDRESDKPGIKQKFIDKDHFKDLLYEFSESFAIDIYSNRERRGGLFIPKEEGMKIESEIALADIDQYQLSDPEKRSRSLLNRSADGKYKFSHKSILEYFLAIKAFNDPEFCKSFSFHGMDAASLFFIEKLFPCLKTSVGYFFTGKNSKDKSLKDLKFEETFHITELIILRLPFDLHHLKVLPKLKKITLTGILEISLLHNFRFILHNNVELSDEISKDLIEKIKEILESYPELKKYSMMNLEESSLDGVDQFKRIIYLRNDEKVIAIKIGNDSYIEIEKHPDSRGVEKNYILSGDQASLVEEVGKSIIYDYTHRISHSVAKYVEIEKFLREVTTFERANSEIKIIV